MTKKVKDITTNAMIDLDELLGACKEDKRDLQKHQNAVSIGSREYGIYSAEIRGYIGAMQRVYNAIRAADPELANEFYYAMYSYEKD